jgi:hypothetical protein
MKSEDEDQTDWVFLTFVILELASSFDLKNLKRKTFVLTTPFTKLTAYQP